MRNEARDLVDESRREKVAAWVMFRGKICSGRPWLTIMERLFETEDTMKETVKLFIHFLIVVFPGTASKALAVQKFSSGPRLLLHQGCGPRKEKENLYSLKTMDKFQKSKERSIGVLSGMIGGDQQRGPSSLAPLPLVRFSAAATSFGHLRHLPQFIMTRCTRHWHRADFHLSYVAAIT